ncbi:MAG: FAD:protein FMN transferase [Verrucomicrobia bacterium]|nr:FAD:protein FMN transferase [Verrucomicrobiota bacterium]
MPHVALARNAMATRFEMILHGADESRLRAAGEEALAEIERIEAQLSFYRPTSEVSRLNAHAADAPVRVDPELFRLLRHALQLARETGGAFDLTVAPLMRAWGFTRSTGQCPDPRTLAEAKACTGWRNVELDERESTVRFARPGVMLDLGALGKGHALGRAAEILREDGVTSALIHGGTSTACAIGSTPDGEPWKVAIERPRPPGTPPPAGPAGLLATVPLRDESLSVSAVWGKSFTVDARVFGHVIDPRTGEPAQGALLAAVALPSAAETDAFSTALLTAGPQGHDALAALRPGMKTLLLTECRSGGGLAVASKGIETSPG